MPLELGQYRDPHLELDRLLRASGPILEKAVNVAVKIHAPFFTQVGPDLRHRTGGETMEEWVKGRRKSNPNDYADFIVDDENQLMHIYTEEAFGPMCCPKTGWRSRARCAMRTTSTSSS